MAIDSNVDELICPSAASLPSTLSAKLAAWRDARCDVPCVDAAPWGDLCSQAGVIGVYRTSAGIHATAASYELLRVRMACGDEARARLIVPVRASAQNPVPVVVVATDADRPTRGWHHLTRFVALGAAVVALDAQQVSSETIGHVPTAFTRLAWRMLAVTRACAQLPELDGARLHVWGEGLGGSLALYAAADAQAQVRSASAANPWGCARIASDAACSLPVLAPRISCPVFIGTGALAPDQDVRAQFALVGALGGPVRHRIYPKHGYERINELENELVRFLWSVW